MKTSQRLLKLASIGTPGLRRLRRPANASTPAFDLSYVRTGPRTSTPTVVIPGGPGLGSVLPYRGLRRLAARGGLDLIMVEHRGVGLSRCDLHGDDLPVSAMWVTEVLDDIAAVLDREGAQQAFIAGSSYGSFLASSFGARHGDRVAGMLLDSALQSELDLEIERDVLRALFWEGDAPVASLARKLVAAGEDERILLDIARAAFELGGAELLVPLLRQRVNGRSGLVWKALEAYAIRDASMVGFPGIYEFDLVGAIGFRELGYGGVADGLPFDPALTYAPSADRFPKFTGAPYDLSAETAKFAWPLVLLSGSRDLRTPPAIAQRVAGIAQNAVLVSIENGHSALDTHPVAMLNAIRQLARGQHDRLPAEADALDRLPLRGLSANLPRYLARGLAAERLLGRR